MNPAPIPTRPDLSQLDSHVREYIEALERELARQLTTGRRLERKARSDPEADDILTDDSQILEQPDLAEPAEPPTTIQLITATATGIAKRTPRHLYARQRRSGMGVFDLETSETDPPVALALADEKQTLLILTNYGRAYRLPVNALPETPVHGRGAAYAARFNWGEDEKLGTIITEQAEGYLAIASQNGMVRLLRHHVFGEYMKPGTPVYDFKAFGPLAGACWTPGNGDLFLATHQGRAIRFSEKLVPPQGTAGIRLTEGDALVGIAAVFPDSGVFLLGADGRGTIRMMVGFTANKAPGAGGKVAFITDRLVSVINSDSVGDIFIISALSKIIRFRVDEVPAKEGVVQGVICMNLRADQTVAATVVRL